MGPTESVYRMKSNGSYVRTVEEKELREKEKEKETEKEKERELHVHVYIKPQSLPILLVAVLLTSSLNSCNKVSIDSLKSFT